jgi:hypothetical protein
MSLVVAKDGIGEGLKAIADQFPREFPKALMDLGQRWKNRIAAELPMGRAGRYLLPPRAPLTMFLRGGIGRRATRFYKKTTGLSKKEYAHRVNQSGGLGGNLPAVVEYQSNAQQGVRVGWFGIKRVGGAAAMFRFQRAENRAFTTAERHSLHQRLGKSIPGQKTKPLRPAITFMAPEFGKEARTVIMKSIRALQARQAAKK